MIDRPTARLTAPPGPRGRAALRAAMGLGREPLDVLAELQHRYGDVVRMRLAGTTLWVLYHPDDVERLLVGGARSVDKGAVLQQLRVLMGDQLFTLEGEEHAFHRRLASGAFRPRDLPPKVEPVVAALRTMATRWHEVGGAPVDVLTELDLAVIDAVAGGLFGFPIGDVAPRIQEVVHALYGYLAWVASPRFPLSRRLRPLRVRRMLAWREQLYGVVGELVARVDAGEGGAAGAMGTDVTSLLLAARDDGEGGSGRSLTRRQVVEEVAGLLVAAHEGIALTVTWALFELARDPALRTRCEVEVDRVLAGRSCTAHEVGELPLLRALVDETVRVYGGTFVLRGVREPIALASTESVLEPGDQVVAGMYVTHRDPRWWSSPSRFSPDRFLPAAAGGPGPGARPRFAYYPFGGGRRTCIGAHLAIQSCVAMLAEIVREWRLDLCDPEPVGVYSQVLVRPARPILLTPTRR